MNTHYFWVSCPEDIEHPCLSYAYSMSVESTTCPACLAEIEMLRQGELTEEYKKPATFEHIPKG